MNKVYCLLVLYSLVVLTNAISIRPNRHVGALNVGLLMRAHADGVELDLSKDDGSYKYFTQQLDHFSPQNTATWQQRYLVNDTFYQGPDSPIFLLLGGEGLMGTSYISGHFIVNQYAQQFNALVVALEHRFYGESIPTADSSTANLRYLSSQQALADAANFRQFIAASYNSTGRWVVFGGSYSGAMSAWLKMKYPHLFHGSIATSAPVWAKADFYEYFETVSQSVGPTCSQRFADATVMIDKMLQTAEGKQQLGQMFNICSPMMTENDVKMFIQGLTDGPSGVVQYNADNVNYQPFDITYMCSILEQGPDPLAAWVNLTLIFQNNTCLEVNYTQYIQEMQPTSDARSWVYQTCQEFGYFQAADSQNQPFSHTLDLEFSIQQCVDIYGIPYTLNTNWTNTYYGSVGLETSNTFMPNGDVDPWSKLGITDSYIGPDSQTMLIHGTAHCADLYPPRPQDAPGLTEARQIEAQLINTWLTQKEA